MFALTSCFDLVYLSLRPGIEKLLCQSFPVHNLQISHLTSAEPWKTLSLIVCCVLSKFGSWFRVLRESHQRSCTASLAMPTTSKPLQLPTLVLCQCVTWRSSMLQWRGVMQTEKKKDLTVSCVRSSTVTHLILQSQLLIHVVDVDETSDVAQLQSRPCNYFGPHWREKRHGGKVQKGSIKWFIHLCPCAAFSFFHLVAFDWGKFFKLQVAPQEFNSQFLKLFKQLGESCFLAMKPQSRIAAVTLAAVTLAAVDLKVLPRLLPRIQERFGRKKMRNLSLNHLLCMEVGEPGDATEAASNGKSKTRIKEAFQKPCCKKNCKRRLTFKLVFSFCTAFWSLSEAGQDSLSPPRNVSNIFQQWQFLLMATSFN